MTSKLPVVAISTLSAALFKMSTDYCQCGNPDHEVSHEIERQTGEYINPCLHVLNPTDTNTTDLDGNTITSVENYVYVHNNLDIVMKFTDLDNYQQISKYLRKNKQIDYELIELHHKIIDLIHNAPGLDFEYTVYRGIDRPLDVNIGDILEHDAFLLTSLNKKYAMTFTNDTTKCYKHGGSLKFSKFTECATLFRIKIPKGTKFLDLNRGFNFAPCSISSKILYDKNLKLLVTDIDSEHIKYARMEKEKKLIVISVDMIANKS